MLGRIAILPWRPSSRKLESGRLAVEDRGELEQIGDLSLKGLSQAVAVYNVVGSPDLLREAGANVRSKPVQAFAGEAEKVG